MAAKSVREIVSGYVTTRAARPPVSHAREDRPNSWTACIPTHEPCQCGHSATPASVMNGSAADVVKGEVQPLLVGID